MAIDDTESFTISLVDPTRIVNSLGHSWSALFSNIQPAINELDAGGELWMPQTALSGPSFTIPYDNIKIHGWGPETILNFTGTYGIMASENPGGNESNWKWGLQNLQLDNFVFTGSPLELVVRKGLLLENLYAQDITKSTAAIRVTCPYGDGSNGYTTSTGHYWPGSIDGMCEDVQIINCQTLRTASHGFHFHYCVYRGCVSSNILLDGCIATRAGHWNSGTGGWSVGFDLGEAYLPSGDIPEATMQNLTIQNCEAHESWESGFHFENKIAKKYIHFINCIANNNGRKYVESGNDGGEAWLNPYGAGYLHSFKSVAETGDIDMTFVNCVANGNGYCGYRNKYSNPPIFTGCEGDEYHGYAQGNARGTYPKTTPPIGSLCLSHCTGITNTNP